MHTALHGTANLPAADWLIRELSLLPHPEGGFYRETYRSPTLDHRGRPAATMIYFLLPQGHVSRLHRLDADEGWHLYLGGPLEIYELDEREADRAPRITALIFWSGRRCAPERCAGWNCSARTSRRFWPF